jgi:hypothetical protein
VEILERRSFYVAGSTVLMCHGAGGSWKIDRSMPTS